MSEEFSKESLGKSEKVIGQLYPRLVNQEGKSLDGDHRFAANPKWEKKVIETENRSEEILVRMHAHHRRRVPQEETKAMIKDLAKELEKAGIKKEDVATELVKITPYVQRYVLQLLPIEYKKPEKVKAGKISAEITEQKAMLAGLVECDRCHMANRETEEYKGDTLCPRCLKLAKHKPERSRVQIPPGPDKVTTSIIKPKLSWKDRKARMQMPVSKMEEAVRIKLEEKGLHPETDREFCLQSTKPDYYFPNKNLAIFLDGADVHRKRQDRDQALRELLTKRHNVKIVSLTYTAYSEAQKDEIVNRIMEATK